MDEYSSPDSPFGSSLPIELQRASVSRQLATGAVIKLRAALDDLIVKEKRFVVITTDEYDVGAFVIKGRYDAANLECHWTKTYIGAHNVFYKGFREGKGIWGTWDIGLFGHGGFRIWPRNAGEGEEQAAKEEPLSVEAIGREETEMVKS